MHNIDVNDVKKGVGLPAEYEIAASTDMKKNYERLPHMIQFTSLRKIRTVYKLHLLWVYWDPLAFMTRMKF